jgi:hypothetical protein
MSGGFGVVFTQIGYPAGETGRTNEKGDAGSECMLHDAGRGWKRLE